MLTKVRGTLKIYNRYANKCLIAILQVLLLGIDGLTLTRNLELLKRELRVSTGVPTHTKKNIVLHVTTLYMYM